MSLLGKDSYNVENKDANFTSFVSKDARKNSKLVSLAHVHIHGLWMLVDGVGLALITAGTVLEGFELWEKIFRFYWETNAISIIFWFSGRACQVLGLIVLIGHAASFQVLFAVEKLGMALLTIGPVLNMSASGYFILNNDPYFSFNRQWVSNEILELIGIVFLDISMRDMDETVTLFIEFIGYTFLLGATMIQFEYLPKIFVPLLTGRMDVIHISEALGLVMLVAVAYVRYRVKCFKTQNLHSKKSFQPTVV